MEGALILGSARCGSTLVSEMLRRHPEILSISELFSMLGPYAFTPQSCDGRSFWRALSQPIPAMGKVGNPRVAPGEFLYGSAPQHRHDPYACPPILTIALPHLSNDPDALFERLRPQIETRGASSLAGHYEALFGMLAQEFGGRVWAERSGGSLAVSGTLTRMFPAARQIVLTRNGPETVLSMRDYPATRLAIFIWRHGLGLIDPIHPRRHFGRGRLWPAIAQLSGGRMIEAILARRPGLAETGRFWSALVTRGLAQLDPRRAAVVSYESLLARPRDAARRLGMAVAETAPKSWLDEVEALPQARPSRLGTLTARERLDLTDACAQAEAVMRDFARASISATPLGMSSEAIEE